MKANAYVLIRTEPRSTNETYRRLCDVPGVKTAHHTTGHWDCVLFVEGNDYTDIPRTVMDKIRKTEGVRDTETLYAFERN